MKISYKWLGLVAMLAAPGLWVECYFYSKQMHNSSITGVADLVYMIGWSCSIIGLIQLRAAGNSKAAMAILYTQLLFLCVANIFNTWTIIDPQSVNPVYKALDWFWPISNGFMIVTGIAVLRGGVLQKGWKYSTLAAGCWLAITAGSAIALQGNTLSFYIMTVYSFISFFLLGLTVFIKGSSAAGPNRPVAVVAV